MANEGVDEKVQRAEGSDGDKSKAGFDWVTERSACSLPKMFKTLLLQIKEDVETRNALRPNNSPYEFSVEEKGESFSAVLKTADVQMSVVFSLVDHAISVRDDKGNQMFEVTITFSEEGKCKLRVNDEERELWQVRRMALEELMFRGY
jgi:hypothetical protein